MIKSHHDPEHLSAAPDGNGFALVKRTERDASARTYLTLMLDWR